MFNSGISYGCGIMQSQVAGLEREIQLAQRQIDLERSKQEGLVRERERCVGDAAVGAAIGSRSCGECRVGCPDGVCSVESCTRAGALPLLSGISLSWCCLCIGVCRLNKARTTAENATAKHADLVKVTEMMKKNLEQEIQGYRSELAQQEQVGEL